MKRFTSSVLFFLTIHVLSGQDVKYYRYDKDVLSKDFHWHRRQALRAIMPDNSVAVFFTNPVRNRSNDNDFQYHQDPDFYYLTGFTEPNAFLVVFKNTEIISGGRTEEIIFVPERNSSAERWTGRRLGKEGAISMLGISMIEPASSFDAMQIDFKRFSKLLYNLPKGITDDKSDKYDLFELTETFAAKAGSPPVNGDTKLLRSLMASLREIKQPEELVLMRHAVNISCDAHIEMMKALKPGMTEYQVQAAGEYVFKKKGSEYVGYPSICGGGENSTILHYISNRKVLSDGDLILLDMGAEYHGYTADVTRTLPVNGNFSNEQEIIYELVLKAQQAGIEACRPGNAFADPHQAAVSVIKKGLMELEIIKNENDYNKYFMHGTSHYLGLDVHDAGSRELLKEGNVITVEPGIYISEGSPCNPKWWNIGIRIEDDILITATGYENLSEKAPRAVADVEKMMRLEPEFVKQK